MIELSLDLSSCPELAGLARIVAALRRHACDYEPLLVGATARDLLLHYLGRIPISRATNDIDFALAVPNWAEFNRLRQRLSVSSDFSAMPGMNHRLQFADGALVDLIPFGAIERADNTIAWPPNEETVMNVIGYTEALLNAWRADLPDHQRVSVISLPALAVLKIVAWQERHLAEPLKDASDLRLVLENYLDVGNEARFYHEALHWLGSPNFDWKMSSAWLLGKDARALLQAGARFSDCHRAITTILTTETNPAGELRLVGEMRCLHAQTAFALLQSFLAGFNGQAQP
jgi:predicted nucleotidyltransferase